MDAIDWRAAQRVGELIAGSPPYGGVRATSVQPLAYEFAERVGSYSGLAPTTELPVLEAVDRAMWIEANLKSMRPLLGALTERMGEGTGPLAGPIRAGSGFLLGTQIGALTGMLSQRVLGQYDVALLEAQVAPRLLLLAPNLALTARQLAVDRDELVLWVSIHEITHAVQFSGAPWLREHLAGMLTQLLDGLGVALDGGEEDEGAGAEGNNGDRAPSNGAGSRAHADDPRPRPAADWWPKLPQVHELRAMVERARRGELLRLTLGEERWELVERMQAAMSLIEGHAEHTMDAIGAEVLPSLPHLRAAMTRRREHRGLPWRVLERLLGLELKLRQYELGRRFCDAVVEAGGAEALALAWRSPDSLPRPEELERPAQWFDRVARESAPRVDPPRAASV